MVNTLLTPTMITREALMILHQKLNFIGNINRQYDDRFAVEGAKIGTTLQIRLPNQYVVRTGATLSTQDTEEEQVTLTVATQKGVDLNFTSVDLTMSLDDFGQRILDPAMAVLAANIEADAFSMINDVAQNVTDSGNAITFADILNGRKNMVDSLTPFDGRNSVAMNTQDNVDLVDALKGLFQSSTEIRDQYRDGLVGITGGFNFFENTLIPDFTSGTAATTTGYLTNGATQTGSTITVDTGTTTFLVGDVVTFAGVFAVHPETKTTLAELKPFVITANSGASATTLSISPAIDAAGGNQNVSNAVADNSAVVSILGASDTVTQSLAYHKDAFTFATADLIMPDGVDFAAREVQDGISMRIIRQYRIGTDDFPTRLDVLYGFKTIRAQLANKFWMN